ncbi:hypothetical protein MesoLjLa_18050 [Mesorhizobium sp. L-2-11]|nr:hypothetical protein MesoLjLa_18050 [Mesorhizobium sp. L-2-11]
MLFFFLAIPGIAQAACINPAGEAGAVAFDGGSAAMQYCNGSDWIAFPKGPGAACYIGSWTARTVASGDWYSITYGNGLFVAVAYSGTNQVMTSPDGINWTARAAPEANQWYSVTYGNGLFVAVSQDGTNRVMTSSDGITWTARAAAEANWWRGVAYGNGLFVAVARNGTNQVMTSPDGINWTARTAAEANLWQAVAYGNGQFVAITGNGGGSVMTSPDGITWTARTVASGGWYSVTYGNGLFVAVANVGTNRVMTSPDGITWTARTASEANPWASVTYGNGLFVAVAVSGTNQVMTSPDGINWTARTAPEANQWQAVTYGNGSFAAVAVNGTNRLMATDCGASAPDHGYLVATDFALTFPDANFGALAGANAACLTHLQSANWLGKSDAVAAGQLHAANVQAWLCDDSTCQDMEPGADYRLATTYHPTAGGYTATATASGYYPDDGLLWDTPDAFNDFHWIISGRTSSNQPATGLTCSNWTSGSTANNTNFGVTDTGYYPERLAKFTDQCGATTVMCMVHLQPACTGPDGMAGSMIFNADYRVAQWCDGSNWWRMGPLNPPGPNDGCTAPVQEGGTLVFNEEYRVLQYCDGDTWRFIGRMPCTACGGAPDKKVVFYTLSEFSGHSIGGVAGADAICQDRANKAGLVGTYKAWIAGSDPASAPATRFIHSPVPYVRVDGIVVADNWTDLIDGSLDNSIGSETGYLPPSANGVRTNVATDGTQAGSAPTDHCSDWSASGTGRIGHRTQIDSDWTDYLSSYNCAAASRLYCFEQ